MSINKPFWSTNTTMKWKFIHKFNVNFLQPVDDPPCLFYDIDHTGRPVETRSSYLK